MRRFIPFWLLLLLIAILLRVDFFFTITYLFAAVFVLSHLWTRQTLRHLRVARRFTPRAFLGEALTVEIEVENTGWLPVLWLELHESFDVTLRAPAFHHEVLSLGPHERQRRRYRLNCNRRGYYTIGPLRLTTGDLLALTPARELTVAEEPIIVYPRVLSLAQLGLPTRSPLVALPAQARIFEDPARIMGMRDYAPGDSLRRIHWTASARAGQLLVKQYQPSIARETFICLDLDWADYDLRRRLPATELAIVTAASLANHVIVRERLPVGLATLALDPLLDAVTRFSLPPRPERAHLMGILETLARVQAQEGLGASFPDWLREESLALGWGATIAVITGSVSPDLLETLLYLRRAGCAVALLLVQPAALDDAATGLASQVGIPIHRIWREQDVEGWQ